MIRPGLPVLLSLFQYAHINGEHNDFLTDQKEMGYAGSSDTKLYQTLKYHPLRTGINEVHHGKIVEREYITPQYRRNDKFQLFKEDPNHGVSPDPLVKLDPRVAHIPWSRQKKVCKCLNGIAATGTSCPNNGIAKCVSCKFGYFLSGDICAANQCSCLNGNAASGISCPANRVAKCDSCKFGYFLSGDSCSANQSAPEGEPESEPLPNTEPQKWKLIPASGQYVQKPSTNVVWTTDHSQRKTLPEVDEWSTDAVTLNILSESQRKYQLKRTPAVPSDSKPPTNVLPCFQYSTFDEFGRNQFLQAVFSGDVFCIRYFESKNVNLKWAEDNQGNTATELANDAETFDLVSEIQWKFQPRRASIVPPASTHGQPSHYFQASKNIKAEPSSDFLPYLKIRSDNNKK